MSVVAMLLAGGQGARLSILSQRRAKPAVPFGGSYRIIDFTMSNVMHAEIPYIGICTQYKPASLMDHIGSGEWWGFTGRDRACRILPPYTGEDDSDWYAGTADAVWQNRQFIMRFDPDIVLVLSGDHIYHMDYAKMIEFHRLRRADLTIAMQRVPWDDTSRFGIAELAQDGLVTQFQEKPKKDPVSNLASLGIYVFDAEVLLRRLQEDASDPHSDHDFGKNVIPAMLARDRVYGHEFDGYWRDVGTIQSFWDANMESLDPSSGLDLAAWRLRTNHFDAQVQNEVSALIASGASVSQSHVSRGCLVEGAVQHSILFPGVRVGRGAVVRDSIIMNGVVLGEGVRVDRCIMDKHCRIDRGSSIGFGSDDVNRELPALLDTGITVVGKGVLLPPGTSVGRNVLVAPEVCPADLPGSDIPSGATVTRRAAVHKA